MNHLANQIAKYAAAVAVVTAIVILSLVQRHQVLLRDIQQVAAECRGCGNCERRSCHWMPSGIQQ
jgi:hypothetical protein